MEYVVIGGPLETSNTTYANAFDARQAIRAGLWRRHTSGLAPAYVQGNVAILPADLAIDFMRFCQRNPKPCPLLAVSEVGQAILPTLGRDVDIRTDVPRYRVYRVYRDGEFTQELDDLQELWRDDLVV